MRRTLQPSGDSQQMAIHATPHSMTQQQALGTETTSMPGLLGIWGANFQDVRANLVMLTVPGDLNNIQGPLGFYRTPI